MDVNSSDLRDENTDEKSDSLDDPLRLFDDITPLEEMDQDLEAFLALIND